MVTIKELEFTLVCRKCTLGVNVLGVGLCTMQFILKDKEDRNISSVEDLSLLCVDNLALMQSHVAEIFERHTLLQI